MEGSMGKRIVIYTVIIIICIACLGIGIYAQFFYKYADKDALLTGRVDEEGKTEEMYQNLKNNFDTIFTNKVNGISNLDVIFKEDQTEDFVYTSENIKETKNGIYDLNVNIPYVNLDLEGVVDINEEIEDIFATKLESIMEEMGTYTIYNIDYASYVNQNILSLVIKATLKEGQNSQRVIIKTYNYDVEKQALVSLDEILEEKELKKEKVEQKIKEEITRVYKENLAFEQAGYTVYKRDIQNSMYKVENTDTFFVGQNGYLYILYPYGNNNYTSEIDMIIF